jgi:hypothetical protein
VGEARAAHQHEELARHVGGRGVPRGPEGELAGALPRERQQFVQVLRGDGRVDDDDVGELRQDGDGDEFRARVVGQVAVDAARGVDADGAEQQRGAVAGAARHGFSADVASGAEAVVDHHLLAPACRTGLRGEARQHVGRAAGGERHDDPHGPLGRGLRRLRGGKPRESENSLSKARRRCARMPVVLLGQAAQWRVGHESRG